MNIKIFKPISGPEIIAELLNEGAEFYRISRPLTIHVMRGPDGNPSLAFSEFSMVTADKSPVILYKSALICEPMEPVPEIAANYQQNVTGLILPQSSGQILAG